MKDCSVRPRHSPRSIRAFEVVGEDNVNRNPAPMVASEDFSFMLERVPGPYFNTGNGAGEGACEVHNPVLRFQ